MKLNKKEILMNSRFFPRYKINNDEFDLFFLGNDPSSMPDILEVVDASLSGIQLKIRNLTPQFTGSKICLRFKSHTLYFQTRVIWTEKLSDEEGLIGLKLIIPTVDTFSKWITIIEEIDRQFVVERNKNLKNQLEAKLNSTVPRASLY